MNKKLWIVIFAIILSISIIILNQKYVKDNAPKVILECISPHNYENYDETLKFIYINRVLNSFYREEVFNPKTKKIRENTINYYNETKSNLEESDDFTYKLTKKDNKIIINTFINVKYKPELFEQYMMSKQFTKDVLISQVKYVLEANNYQCEVKYQ